MNRPIKFRAWVPNDIAIWLTSERKEVDGKQTSAHMRYDVSSIRFWDDGLPIQVSFQPENTTLSGMRRETEKPMVLMQFTGLLDKNGKEIYEGDVMTDRSVCNDAGGETLYSVGFRDGAFRIENTNCTCGCIGTAIEGAMESEVIGNVWENPELLGV